MAIVGEGTVSLSDIQAEFGGENPIGLSEYYRGAGYTTSNNTNVPESGAISLSDFYGATNQFAFTISSNTKEANLATLATDAGWDGVSPLVATVASGVYLWSDNTSVGGLIVPDTITTAVTLYNNGYIIGKGGSGGGGAGGPALVNQISGVTLINNSGAFIAGGGGGGAGQGGGGGAGGGTGGSFGAAGGAGGAIGQAGANGDGTFGTTGRGGGAGGGGGNYYDAGSGAIFYGAGGGGGRILPGVGGAAVCDPGIFGYGGGAGGSGGNAGGVGCNGGFGGGGGWGAVGGAGGGAGGAAISGTAVSLTNNGTIYGAVA